MRRERLEEAITEFDYLLADPSSTEAGFQDLFERHGVILEAMGYVKAVPRPRLPLSSGGWLEPDFLAQRANGIWEVLDLKTPAERVLLDRARRNTFDAPMNSYIAQVDEYAGYFADAGNRERCREAHGIDVQPTVDTVIIAGRDDTVDVIEVHRHARRLSRKLDVVTFDRVLAGLEALHAVEYAALEDLAGVTSLSNMRIRPSSHGGRGYVQEVWGRESAAAFALFLDDLALAIEVLNPPGRCISREPRYQPHSISGSQLLARSAPALRMDSSKSGSMIALQSACVFRSTRSRRSAPTSALLGPTETASAVPTSTLPNS